MQEFHVWGTRDLVASLIASEYKELSISDKQKICQILKVPFESVWFAPTHEPVFPLVSEKPTFINEEGRKFWLRT